MDETRSDTLETAANLKAAFLLNLAFTIFEIVGGIWTNSLAILSDSLHDLGDSFTLGVSWFLERYSARGVDGKYSYGYRRFSLLAALLSTVVLIVGSLFILSEATRRLLEPEHSNAQGMILFALVGIAVNGIAVLRLRGGKSFNARMVAWHLLEDVLGWTAVLVVGITLLFRDIHILDPLLSTLITLYVLYNVVGNLRKTLSLFLQAVPEDVSVEELERRIVSIKKVRTTHHTHVWSLDGLNHVLTCHVVVEDDTAPSDVIQIKRDIAQLCKELPLEHTTFEIEYESEACGMRAG